MPYVVVARTSAIPDQAGRVCEAGERSIAVFAAGSTYYACDNVCPHRGGPLGEGDFDGRVVTCPWHGWQFDLTTGVNPLMPAAKVATYPVRVSGDDVEIDLP